MSKIYLGYPPPNVKQWIIDHIQPPTRPVTRIWWSNDESDYSDCPSNNGTFDSSCFPNGKSAVNAVKVEFGSDVTIIDVGLFPYCFGLTSVLIPNSVTTINMEAFLGCGSLTTLTIPESVTYISQNAFSECSSLTDLVIGKCLSSIPSRITNIDSNAFQNCTNLANITIGNNVKYVLDGCFSNCESLTNITISDNVEYIANNAFDGCTGLTSVTIVANGGNANDVKQMMIDAGVSSSIIWNMPS